MQHKLTLSRYSPTSPILSRAAGRAAATLGATLLGLVFGVLAALLGA